MQTLFDTFSTDDMFKQHYKMSTVSNEGVKDLEKGVETCTETFREECEEEI